MSSTKMEERKWIPQGQLSPVKGDMDSFTMNSDENMECSELSIA
jgi:hypothetical protein